MKTREERRSETLANMDELVLSPATGPLTSSPETPRRTPKKKKHRKWWLLALVVLLIAGGVSAWMWQKRRVLPVEIQTEKVALRNLTEVVVANGKIQPVIQVKISPEVSGEIVELPVKEGQKVNKGDLLLRIKRDFYLASHRSAEASYQAAVSGKVLAEANLNKASVEFKRSEQLLAGTLISESEFLESKTAFQVAEAQLQSATHQVEVANAALARANEELAKTTIYSPISGTVSKLNAERGERVVGTAMMSGTEIMTIADLNEMEARVDIGEIDVVLIAVGQKARLEVDAFRDQKFSGIVTEIANSSRGQSASSGQSSGSSGQQQDATRFEVRIRVQEKEAFRPGMSVTADIETRSRTNALTVPIQSVTTRLPKGTDKAKTAKPEEKPADKGKGEKKEEGVRPIEVVFLREGDTVKMAPVKRGISDDNYTEITEGLTEGQEVVSGGYKAISRELEDGKKIKIGAGTGPKPTEKK